MSSRNPLEVSPRRVGSPRLDPYRRLLGRFYEQLFLLEALGQTRGNHTPEPDYHGGDQAVRRSFLRNLSYICDFKKGGTTCTAIGLESLDTSYRFWIASNMEVDCITKFLKLALGTLRDLIVLSDSNSAAKEEELIRNCVEFATERVKSEKRCLQMNAEMCRMALMNDEREPRRDLALWLKNIADIEDHLPLCQRAYEIRHTPEMDMLERLASEAERDVGPSDRRSSFTLTRHYIGRLADHIRAPKKLVEESRAVSYLLETHDIAVVERPFSVPPPTRDRQTNLRGILNRMMKSDGAERNVIEEGFCYIDHVDGLFNRFLEHYEHNSLVIHAEIQVLEHFHRRRLSFVGDDRFIACSKPACLCCLMYFKHHPARPVKPSSHLKVWAKWSPPFVEGFDNRSPESKQQRDILNMMVQEIRGQVISQVLQRSQPSRWHPDSRTGITEIELFRSISGSAEILNTTVCSGDPQGMPRSCYNANPRPELVDVSDPEDGGVPIPVSPA